jgi:hypothetical protein
MISKLSILWIVSFAFTWLPSSHAQTFECAGLDWTINIPTGFEFISPGDWHVMKNQGKRDAEEKIDNVSFEDIKYVLACKDEAWNYLEASLSEYDSSLHESFDVHCKETGDMLQKLMFSQLPGAGSSGLEEKVSIDDKEFYHRKVCVYTEEVFVVTHMFVCLLGDEELTIMVTFRDQDTGDGLVDAVTNSRFGKASD